jgi:SAM-dependent methyltransferase
MSTDNLTKRAEDLGQNWEKRARSEARDFYVSSHPGWNNKEAWEGQARQDVSMILHGLDSEQIENWHLLEIGCGVGRLAPELRRRMASYTGFDIAPGMVEEAVRRNGEIPGVRFSVSDGTGPPEDVTDRKYDMVLAFAVFIHCPREVTAANIKSAYELLAPGGQLRFQIRANPEDREGVVSLEAAKELHEQMLEVEKQVDAEEALSEVELLAMTDENYMGSMFTYAESGPWLAGLTDGEVTLVRVDLASIYGWIVKPL